MSSSIRETEGFRALPYFLAVDCPYLSSEDTGTEIFSPSPISPETLPLPFSLDITQLSPRSVRSRSLASIEKMNEKAAFAKEKQKKALEEDGILRICRSRGGSPLEVGRLTKKAEKAILVARVAQINEIRRESLLTASEEGMGGSPFTSPESNRRSSPRLSISTGGDEEQLKGGRVTFSWPPHLDLNEGK